MKANFNGIIIDYEDVSLHPDNRGFRYGDGLFETIAVVNNSPRFPERHFQRIRKGTTILQLNPVFPALEFFSDQCRLLLQHNHSEKHQYGKIRVFIWREGSGLYQPENDQAGFLLTFHSAGPETSVRILNNVDYCEHIRNYSDTHSGLKTISALKYVVAGLERRAKGLEEIIILDYQGNISESLYSNIFIKKGKKYLTPPLTSGCVEGIMRGWMMDALRGEQFSVEEKHLTKDDMNEADSIFLTNALGIQHISRLKNREFETDPVAQRLIESVS